MYQIARAASLDCDYNTKLSRSHWTLNLWIILLSWEQQVLEKKKSIYFFLLPFDARSSTIQIQLKALVWFGWQPFMTRRFLDESRCFCSIQGWDVRRFAPSSRHQLVKKKITLGICFWCWYWSKISQLKGFKKAISLFLEKVHHKK